MTSKILAEVVRDARKHKGLSQIEVAELVGMSQRWISDIERGATENPHLPALRRLANVLDMDIADLIIAGGMANTRSGAQRLIESIPEDADDDSPLTPDEEAVLAHVMFTGFSSLTPRKLRELIRVIQAEE